MQDAPPTSQRSDSAPVKTVLIIEDDADIAEALTYLRIIAKTRSF